MSSLNDYIVLGTVGAGSYATCKKIKRKCDGKLLVWKEISYGNMTESEKQMLVSEVNLLRELKHPNIVRYYDRIIDRSNAIIYIVMELCEGGDLDTYIRNTRRHGEHVAEDFVWKVLIQVARALTECHHRKSGQTVLHRDLKPANVFLDANNDIKIGDFGLARILHHDTSFAKTFVGTPYYMSPELVNNISYGEKSDVWSLGCMIYELCTHSPPFTASNQTELNRKIRCGIFPSIASGYSPSLCQVITKMLQVETYKRPSMSELLKEPAVAQRLTKYERRRSATPLANIAPICQIQRVADKIKPPVIKVTESNDQKIDEVLEKIRRRERLLELKEKEIESREASVSVREKLAEIKLERVMRMSTCPGCQQKENQRCSDVLPTDGMYLSPYLRADKSDPTSMECFAGTPSSKEYNSYDECNKENNPAVIVTDTTTVEPTKTSPRGRHESQLNDNLENVFIKRELLRRKRLQDKLFTAKLRLARNTSVDARQSDVGNKPLLCFR